MHILPIPLSQMDDWWPHIWPHLSRGVEVCGRPREELAQDIIHDRARVWMAAGDNPVRVTAAWLTEVVVEPGKRTLMIFGMGGDRPSEWASDAASRMEAYAREEGCTAARFAGRKGWARFHEGCKEVGRVGSETVYERAIA